MSKIRINDNNRDKEWEKLVDAVRNNQRDIYNEWISNSSASKQKRAMRNKFGSKLGDILRYEGYGAINIGPITKKAIERFMIKLGKSLFYKNNNKIFTGTMFCYHHSLFDHNFDKEFWNYIISISPKEPNIVRNNMSLKYQFNYRYSNDTEEKIIFLIIEFSPELIFNITLIQSPYNTEFFENFIQNNIDIPQIGRFDF